MEKSVDFLVNLGVKFLYGRRGGTPIAFRRIHGLIGVFFFSRVAYKKHRALYVIDDSNIGYDYIYCFQVVLGGRTIKYEATTLDAIATYRHRNESHQLGVPGAFKAGDYYQLRVKVLGSRFKVVRLAGSNRD